MKQLNSNEMLCVSGGLPFPLVAVAYVAYSAYFASQVYTVAKFAGSRK